MPGKSSKSPSGGAGCASIVQVVFVVLKLIGLIDWSWWWVMSPALIFIAFVLLLLAAIFAVRVFVD